MAEECSFSVLDTPDICLYALPFWNPLLRTSFFPILYTLCLVTPFLSGPSESVCREGPAVHQLHLSVHRFPCLSPSKESLMTQVLCREREGLTCTTMSRLERELGPVGLFDHGNTQCEQLPAWPTGSVGPASSLRWLIVRDGNPETSCWCYL